MSLAERVQAALLAANTLQSRKRALPAPNQDPEVVLRRVQAAKLELFRGKQGTASLDRCSLFALKRAP